MDQSYLFSLQLDAPSKSDEDVARLVRLWSQERFARPVGIVDDLIRHIQARQRSATLTTSTIQRVSRRREGEEAVRSTSHAGEEAGSSRRHKKRGGSTRDKHQEGALLSHMHLMYREDDEHEQMEEERDTADA